MWTGEAARTVCHRAVEHGSTDNISCMVVVLCSDAVACADTKTFTPGQLTAEALQSISFIQAYAKMANRAGMGFAQSCEKRYELLEGACKLGLSWRELDPISFQKKSCRFQYNQQKEDHQCEVPIAAAWGSLCADFSLLMLSQLFVGTLTADCWYSHSQSAASLHTRTHTANWMLTGRLFRDCVWGTTCWSCREQAARVVVSEMGSRSC